MDLIRADTTPVGFAYPVADENGTRAAEVRNVKITWPEGAWQPLGRDGFTAIVGSRDPLKPTQPSSASERRPPPSRIEPTAEETLSGERLALVVRKHSGVALSREEQARLLLLTGKLEGRSLVNTSDGGLAAINARFEEVDAAMRDLDSLLGFTRDADQ